MTLVEFTQFGVGIFAIAAIIILVKEFMKFIAKQQADFKEVIANHIQHSTNAMVRMEKSQDKLNQTITQLLQWLTRKNGNK